MLIYDSSRSKCNNDWEVFAVGYGCLGRSISLSGMKKGGTLMLRIEFSGALYHVTSRGDGREDIYLEKNDQESFINVLAPVCERFNWVVHAYCLMSKHYTFLLKHPMQHSPKECAS